MAEAPWRQAAAPPPPPGAVGHIPSSKLKSEISDRRVEPPLCVQNAMLTKDKKPFTYTPGGLDLSEIRSPRMARRLELNAMNEGVAPLPQSQPYHPSGPLPPSALAAMQPQLPVQVFPAGGIPQPHHHGGGPPPPPPPPSGVPPPPPKAPPMRSSSPVPLDAFERPDMTKIIPENPMSLLRKTSGPVIKRDPIFNKDNFSSGNRVNDVANSRQPPQKVESPPVRQPESPQKVSTAGVGSIYVPPINQNAGPATPPNRQPQSPQFVNQRESPPTGVRAPPAYYKRQPSTPQPEPQSPQFIAQKQPPAASSSPQREPQSPESPKVSLSKAPTPWLQKRPQQQDMPEWVVNNQTTQSPPIVQEQQQQPQIKQDSQQQWQQQQQQQQSAPWRQQQQYQPEPQQWQQRQQPEPQPWQQKQPPQPEAQPWQRQQQQQQQPEPQPWQQRQQQQPQTPPWQQQQQQQSPPVQIPKGSGVKKTNPNARQSSRSWSH
ncbi:hypothetical protein ILUMI_10264 [Ignelater luminosus]|uniref:Uncharacterized protein n=1 Tax=Ignelater luminosus TaxID=2038154 RepID=A0A8K0CY86_IGNLU|nr:hypothetical protein ILUMI_10264 [Ignelater luminosus]